MPATASLDSHKLDAASKPFVLRWNHLVSTTNWEKGRIIFDWRKAQKKADAPADERSDEAWANRVGQVSPQHVGRLRRVFEKFGKVQEDYSGLYWSHFSAAMDWDDAEMWLEGAVQNRWSISQMRNKRWEALGAPADKKPRPEDVIAAELDEDAAPAAQPPGRGAKVNLQSGKTGPDHSQGPDFGDEAAKGVAFDPDKKATRAAKRDEGVLREKHAQPVRPFEDLPELPDDLSEAFELFKLSLLRHKLSGWREVALDDVLACLEGLKRLALAPSA